MSFAARVAWVIHVLALSLWIAALISGGVAAAFVFGTLPDLEITMAQYDAYAAGDARVHGRLASGMILERIFSAVDFAQVGLAPLVLATLLFQILVFKSPLRRPANLVRCVCVGVAFLLAAYHILYQAPTMNHHLRDYWTAAAAGDAEGAGAHQERFEAYHPRAEAIMQINLLLLLIALGSGVIALAPRPDPRDRTSPSSFKLEKPRLAS